MPDESPAPRLQSERVQTGVRLEKRLLKVLKGLAEVLDLSLGDLLEGMVLHAFAGQSPFSPATLQKIERLREIYGLDLTAEDSHRLVEGGEDGAAAGDREREGEIARRAGRAVATGAGRKRGATAAASPRRRKPSSGQPGAGSEG